VRGRYGDARTLASGWIIPKIRPPGSAQVAYQPMVGIGLRGSTDGAAVLFHQPQLRIQVVDAHRDLREGPAFGERAVLARPDAAIDPWLLVGTGGDAVVGGCELLEFPAEDGSEEALGFGNVGNAEIEVDGSHGIDSGRPAQRSG
jgi:hypothetical protein